MARLNRLVSAAILVLCVVLAMSGRYPPAVAQVPAPANIEDALQDKSILDHQKEIDGLIAAQTEMARNFNQLASAYSGLDGQIKGVGIVLGLLQVINMVTQSRSNKKAT